MYIANTFAFKRTKYDNCPYYRIHCHLNGKPLAAGVILEVVTKKMGLSGDAVRPLRIPYAEPGFHWEREPLPQKPSPQPLAPRGTVGMWTPVDGTAHPPVSDFLNLQRLAIAQGQTTHVTTVVVTAR